jgi:outer membrane protein OmpA-like peptidoglycan-associated protein
VHICIVSSQPTKDTAIDDVLNALHETDRAIFLVAGHTNSTGSEDYNYALGQQRAASVAQYLMAANGIHPMRITTVSFGERTPMAENPTQQGRFRNRHIEIQAYQQTISSSPGAP